VATSGDRRLGGGDFDDTLVEWALSELRTQYDLHLDRNLQARLRIKFAVEEAKRRLSSHKSASLSLLELRPSEPPVLTLTRDQLETLIDHYLTRTLVSVNDAIQQAGARDIARDKIEAVLLVGGSTKIPLVRRRLARYFDRDDDFVKADLNPDAVVARGAALLASRFEPSPPPFDLHRPVGTEIAPTRLRGAVSVISITEHSLGVGLDDDRCRRLIQRGTGLPTSQSDKNFTNAGPSSAVLVPVYQGEGEMVFDNTLIGTLTIDGLEPRESGFHQFDIKYALDENGLLSVDVRHTNSDRTFEATFDHPSLVRSENQLELLRDRLLRLYTPGPAAPTYEPPPPTPESASARSQPAAPAGESEPAVAETSMSDRPADDDGERVPEALDVSAGPEFIDGPSVDEAPASEAVRLELDDVPMEFRSLVRRVRKQLLRTPDDEELRDAFDRFARAVNQDALDDQVTDLGDDLADVYASRLRER
jgi:molecular chaperone DnaK